MCFSLDAQHPSQYDQGGYASGPTPAGGQYQPYGPSSATDSPYSTMERRAPGVIHKPILPHNPPL